MNEQERNERLPELLRLAAKAAGIKATSKRGGVTKWFSHGIEWQPHLDNGDSRRLQVALTMDLVYYRGIDAWMAEPGCLCWERIKALSTKAADFGGNSEEAARWAVLLCAAEVGRGRE